MRAAPSGPACDLRTPARRGADVPLIGAEKGHEESGRSRAAGAIPGASISLPRARSRRSSLNRNVVSRTARAVDFRATRYTRHGRPCEETYSCFTVCALGARHSTPAVVLSRSCRPLGDDR